MDQGVICSLNVVRKIIRSAAKKKNFPKTVVNCFQKSEISRESQKAAIAENDHSFKELEEEIENMDAVSFTDVNPEVLAVQPPHSDAEIVAKLLETEDVSNDNRN